MSASTPFFSPDQALFIAGWQMDSGKGTVELMAVTGPKDVDYSPYHAVPSCTQHFQLMGPLADRIIGMALLGARYIFVRDGEPIPICEGPMCRFVTDYDVPLRHRLRCAASGFPINDEAGPSEEGPWYPEGRGRFKAQASAAGSDE